MSNSNNNKTHPLNPTVSNLAGLPNSITAMLDDILVGYASAQLMVGSSKNATSTFTPMTVQQQAIRLGQASYIYAVAALNILILVLVVGEAVRTRLWDDLPEFDYLDLRCVVVGASRGGGGVARRADEVRCSGSGGKGEGELSWWKWGGRGDGEVGGVGVRLDRRVGALKDAGGKGGYS